MARVRTARNPRPAEIEPEFESQETPDEKPARVLEPAEGFTKVSKTEAVRIALSEGLDSLDDIQAFVRAKFGHDMTKAHVSSYKSRLGSREDGKPAAHALEATATGPDSATESHSAGKSMNKSQAARAAIDAGYDKPAEAVEYIAKEFGIEMQPTHFSAIKSQPKRKGAPQGRPGREPAAVEGYLAPPPIRRGDGELDLIESLKALKPLVASLGVEKVKARAELLG